MIRAIFVLFFCLQHGSDILSLILMSHFYLTAHPSSFRSPSFTRPPRTLSRAGLHPALGSCSKKKITKSPDTFAHFLRLFAFHMDGQLHFTGIILDGNILIIPVNCQCSTLSSIISDSFEFLLAASMHKFHKR